MSGLLDDPARAAAVAAARTRIEPGMAVGLGSGRAVFALIDLLGATWTSPRRPLRAVAASSRNEARARAAGIELVDLDDVQPLDLAVDGADEVDPALRLLKGGGADQGSGLRRGLLHVQRLHARAVRLSALMEIPTVWIFTIPPEIDGAAAVPPSPMTPTCEGSYSRPCR